MTRDEELRHLNFGVYSDERPNGIGTVRFSASCPDNATDVLQRCKSVLQIVVGQSGDHWGSVGEWKSLLPQWFVEQCSSEMTQDEQERWLEWWRGLSPDEQSRAELEAKWSLEDWLYWMEPTHRKWFWWDASTENSNSLQVAVEVEEWPFAWESLAWLLRAAGALSVENME